MGKNTQSILFAFLLGFYTLKTLISLFLSSYKLNPAHHKTLNIPLTLHPTFLEIFLGLVIVTQVADLNKKACSLAPIGFTKTCDVNHTIYFE